MPKENQEFPGCGRLQLNNSDIAGEGCVCPPLEVNVFGTDEDDALCVLHIHDAVTGIKKTEEELGWKDPCCLSRGWWWCCAACWCRYWIFIFAASLWLFSFFPLLSLSVSVSVFFYFFLGKLVFCPDGLERDWFQFITMCPPHRAACDSLSTLVCATLTCMSLHYCSACGQSSRLFPELHRLILQLLFGAREHRDGKSSSHKFWQPRMRSCHPDCVWRGNKNNLDVKAVSFWMWVCPCCIYHRF